MKKPAPTSPATQKVYDTIADALGARGVVASAMFGMPTLKVGGKGFAGVFGDALVFKLTGAAHANATKLRGAELFDPSGMGRPMKEWVVVPKAHAKAWPELAEEALAYVGTAAKGAAKAAAPKKSAPDKGAKKAAKRKAATKKR